MDDDTGQRAADGSGIVFDMDGVLIDTEHWWDGIRRDIAAEYDGTWSDHATTDMLGMSTPEWARYMVDAVGVRLGADDVARIVIDRMVGRVVADPPVIPGAVDAVRDAARRAPVAIATSAPPRLVSAFLESTDLHAAVSFAVTSEQAGAGKPDPAVYLAAARGIGADPQRCFAVEDSTNGMRAALAAGMTLIAAPNTTFPPDPSVIGHASAVIGSVAELGPVLDRLPWPHGPR